MGESRDHWETTGPYTTLRPQASIILRHGSCRSSQGISVDAAADRFWMKVLRNRESFSTASRVRHTPVRLRVHAMAKNHDLPCSGKSDRSLIAAGQARAASEKYRLSGLRLTPPSTAPARRDRRSEWVSRRAHRVRLRNTVFACILLQKAGAVCGIVRVECAHHRLPFDSPSCYRKDNGCRGHKRIRCR